MAGYVFFSNSTKPTSKEQASREEVKLTNVSRPCLKAALKMGYDVFFGTNRADPKDLKCELPVKMYDSHTYRSITAFDDNKTAINNLKKIVKENDIKVIHCNTPVGGMVGRVVGKLYHVNKVIYTAHGFHFYNGAPFFNRSVLKFAEQIMARWTDALITMNEEDFQAAQNFKLKKGGKVYKVHGVGIDLKEYNEVKVDYVKKRTELGLKESDFVCISAGDLVARKNYATAIMALSRAKSEDIHYLICGEGTEKEKLKKITIDLGLADRVHFLGFRKDIKELMKISDVFLFTTLQEGLPRSMMEAMACGLPCIASKIRGNTDLIDEGKGGFLCNPTDVDGFSSAMDKLRNDPKLCDEMSLYNLENIKNFDISVVEKEIENIYTEVLG